MPKITELPGKQEKGDMRMSDFKPITTQEEFDAAIKARLSREKEKYGDYDQLKDRVEELEKENVGLKSTIEANNQSKADADKQLEEMQNQISNYETASLRTRIALQHGLPYDLADRLQGTDEESFKADAERLAGYIKRTQPVAPVRETEPQVGDNKTMQMKSMLRELNHTGE
jgi:predicted nuclease with TOPRIM domain